MKNYLGNSADYVVLENGSSNSDINSVTRCLCLQWLNVLLGQFEGYTTFLSSSFSVTSVFPVVPLGVYSQFTQWPLLMVSVVSLVTLQQHPVTLLARCFSLHLTDSELFLWYSWTFGRPSMKNCREKLMNNSQQEFSSYVSLSDSGLPESK